MSNSRRVSQNYIWLVIGILAVSTAAILIRFAMEEVSALVIAAYRMTFAAILALAIWLFSKREKNARATTGEVLLMALSGLFLALHFASWITSLQLVSVSSSVILVTTTPLWVALLSPVVLKEHVSTQFYLGLALAVIGGVLIAFNEACAFGVGGFSCNLARVTAGSNKFLGLFLALFGAWMASGYMLIGRKLGSKIPTIPYTAIVYTTAALLLDLAVVLKGEKLAGFSTEAYLFLVAMAVVPQAIGHTLLNHSLHNMPATVVSLALLGEPIGSTILAILFLKETPSALEVVGGVVILLGIHVAVWPRRTNEA